MVTVEEKLYEKMPQEIKSLFKRLPNPGSEEVLECFPNTKPSKANLVSDNRSHAHNKIYGEGKGWGERNPENSYTDSGSAARFFKTCPYEEGEGKRLIYSPKASKKDRDEGLEGNDVSNRPFEERKIAECAKCGNRGLRVGSGKQLTCGHTEIVYKDVEVRPAKNGHPTVKPTALMRYLVKLVTPPGGTVLDPFTGSGSTGKACKLEGFEFIGIEREEEYVKIAKARIEAVSYTPTLL